MSMTDEDLCRMNKVLRHRLRNFATGIKSSIGLLSHEAEGKLEEGDMEYFPLISSECDEIKLLTERMSLLFDRPVSAGAGSTSAEQINSILEELVGRFCKKHPTANISLSLQDGLMGLMPVSENNIMSAVDEVVRNAWESDKNGEVALECSSEAGNIVLRIFDSGEGVQDENLDDIFLPFFTTRSKHVGIGLAISQRVIADSGGSLIAENMESGGLKIEMRIPLREES